MTGKGSERCDAASSEDGGKGHRQPLEPKGREKNCPLELPERNATFLRP